MTFESMFTLNVGILYNNLGENAPKQIQSATVHKFTVTPRDTLPESVRAVLETRNAVLLYFNHFTAQEAVQLELANNSGIFGSMMSLLEHLHKEFYPYDESSDTEDEDFTIDRVKKKLAGRGRDRKEVFKKTSEMLPLYVSDSGKTIDELNFV